MAERYYEPLPATIESLQYVHEKISSLYLNCQAELSDIRRTGSLQRSNSTERDEVRGRIERISAFLAEDECEAQRGFGLFCWFHRAQDANPQKIGRTLPVCIHDEAFNRGAFGRLALVSLLAGDLKPIKAYMKSKTEPLGNPEEMADAMSRELARACNLLTDHNASGAVTGQQDESHLSRPLTKSEAARFHNGAKVSNPSDYIKNRIASNTITPPIGDGQRRRYDTRQFPESVRDSMK